VAQGLTPSELALLVEFGEAEAYADFFLHAPAHLGMRVERIAGAIVLIAPRMPMILMNRVIGLGLVEPATEAMIDNLLSLYRNSGAKTFAVQISPATKPSTLPEWLSTRGLPRRDNWSKVYRGTEPPPEIQTDLRIERINQTQAAACAQVATAAFAMPASLSSWIEAGIGRKGWYHYMAFDSDEPAAVGALFVRGKIGWLGLGGTLSTHRRRGAQGALMARRIRDAIALGCEWIISETGEDVPERPNPSYHNMLRTGFHLAYQRPNYIFK
jgi:hypothetical protein